MHWRLRLPSVPLFIETKEAVLSSDSPIGTRHVLFLHGWNAGGDSLAVWQRELRAVASPEWTFWRIDYPTHRWSFTRAAAEIAHALRATGHDFEDVVIFGFSMGGVTARQMVADGFLCRALVALGSPHQGVARWVPAHSPGTASIRGRSRQLASLNRNPADIAARGRYHFYSLTYRDRFGRHPHDGLIPRRSAQGLTLGPVASRINTEFTYDWPPGNEPHLRGMNPADVPVVAEKMRELLR